MAVKNARFKVDQTRAHLEATREAYNNATTKLLEQRKQMDETIAYLDSLVLTNDCTKATLPVLKTAISTFAGMSIM